MEKPKEVIEFYNSLENITSISIWNIQNELKYSKNIDAKWESNIICERKALTFNINNGKLTSNVQLTNLNGLPNKIKLFNKDELAYFKKRLLETNNSWLKARYSHLLWQEESHLKYAEKAIENYFNLLVAIKPDEVREHLILISAILYISKKTKIRVEEIKNLMFDLIKDTPNWYKGNLLNEFIELDYFKNSELLDIADNIPHWFSQNEYFQNKNNLFIGIKLYKKLNKSSSILYSLLAVNEDYLISKHPDETDFLRTISVGDKCQYLKKANKNEEYQENLIYYNKLKQKVKLNKVSDELNFEVNEAIDRINKEKSEFILKYSTDEILMLFSLEDELLVDPKANKENAKKQLQNSIRNHISMVTFDINLNFKRLENENKTEEEALNLYSIEWFIKFYLLFLKVFMQGIIQGKFTYYSIYSYLEKHTWYNQKFRRKLKENKTEENANWLSLIAPGLHSFFTQFELSVLLNTNKVNNYILAIDSLTLKFEGAIRDFIGLCGGFTSTFNSRTQLLQEQNLDELLSNPKILELFSDRDIELFKFAFSKNGKNIRNDVAHSFMSFTDYSLEKMSLIFLCFLRLGKYELTEKKPTSNQRSLDPF